jgi:peroxiredoxin
MNYLLRLGALCAAILATSAHGQATVGQPAPAFRAADIDGKPVQLSDLKGKHVVLEWFSTSCPFSGKHYISGNMPNLQQAARGKDVVWVAINSDARDAADTKGVPQIRTWLKSHKATPAAVVLDRDGVIGKAYGARATPHMFVINPQGTLVYAGAIDNRPSTDTADIAGATNYVTQALQESQAGKPVSHPRSQAYGCAIKYAGTWRSLF